MKIIRIRRKHDFINHINICTCNFLGLYFTQIKGSIGENRVARKLNSLPQNQYRLINNVLIKTNNGSSQIGHVLVSVYGIFVILIM